MTPDEQRQIQARQRARSKVTAIVLILMAILFFAITLAKIAQPGV